MTERIVQGADDIRSIRPCSNIEAPEAEGNVMRVVAEVDLERVERDSGVSIGLMRAAAQLFAGSRATIACWAMGITQHVNGVAKVESIVNLLLMGGHFGRPGAGACPVRGHSNVQGDRTVGVWEVTGETGLILPCLGRTERDRQPSGEQLVTTENSMGRPERPLPWDLRSPARGDDGPRRHRASRLEAGGQSPPSQSFPRRWTPRPSPSPS